MPTDRQIVANQMNARKSTGPRSKEGRQASSRNARRHGLAVAVGSDPAFQAEIEKLARLLSPSSSQDALGAARQAAEAEFELLRIRTVRAWLFQTLYFAKANAPDGLAELNGKLGKLERYERRAFSRRKSALRAMVQAAVK